jgi:hypothetical protein
MRQMLFTRPMKGEKIIMGKLLLIHIAIWKGYLVVQATQEVLLYISEDLLSIVFVGSQVNLRRGKALIR